MADKTTFVKVDRNIMNWRWYQNANTFRVFLHLIMIANIEDHDFEKITIHRGEVATSIPSLSHQLKISEKSVRTALDHLKATGEVACRIYPHYQVISIPEYDRYQAIGAGNGQATGRQTAGNGHQSKKVRNKEGKNGKNSCGDTTTTVRVPPPREDVETYCRENGISTDVDAFINYNAARGWKRGKIKAADWRPLLMQWISKDSEYGQRPQEPTEKEFE